MDLTETDDRVVRQVYEAMQAGEAGKETLAGLFAEDAVFIEPFSGAVQTHSGIEAIRARTYEMVQQPRPPDFQLKIDQVTTENGELAVYWTCTSASMPGPIKGRDELKIANDKISYLKIEVLSMPGRPS